ncbi:MAG: hypothetical protein QXI84_09400 [Thermofilaceae archaeon]
MSNCSVELVICKELCDSVPNPAGFRYRGILLASSSYCEVLDGAVYKRLGAEGKLFVFERGNRLYAGAPVYPQGFYLIHELLESSLFAEYPAPPYVAREPAGLVWSRFISSDFRILFLPGGRRAQVDDKMRDDVLSLGRHAEPASEVLMLRYKGRWLQFEERWENMFTELLNAKFPGSGRLVGEEFRIVEPDADYLRLVGRGGDEYIAWDFVLGTLDTGEWIIMADDGLYAAKREGDRVVVASPYYGSVLDVRGPPTAYKYPVVPTRTFKHAVGANIVHDKTLLKWPLFEKPAQRRPAELPRPSILLNVLRGVGHCCGLYKAYNTGECGRAFLRLS